MFTVRPFAQTFQNFLFLSIMLLLSGCLGNQSARKGRPLISDLTLIKERAFCTQLIDLHGPLDQLTQNDLLRAPTQNPLAIFQNCVQTCPIGQRLANSVEIDDILTARFSGNAAALMRREFELNLTHAVGACLDPQILQSLKPQRPSNQVFITGGFCSCLAGKPDLLNNDCVNICANRPSTNFPQLVVETTLGAEILNHANLGSLANWCQADIQDGLSGALCNLELRNGSQEINLEILNFDQYGNNSFSVNLQSVPFDQTFVATIVEKGSGSNAKSKEFQIKRTHPAPPVDLLGPLKLHTASQYTCLSKIGVVNDGNITVTDVARVHYYFVENNEPPALPPHTFEISCHDEELYGLDDRVDIPRLELIPHHFRIWNASDQRFFDLDGTGRLDINEQIEERLFNEYGIVQTVNLFSEFLWPNSPNNANTSPRLGFVMQPSLDAASGKVFCPKQNDYNGNTPLFKILKTSVGVDTEGLFMALREAQFLTDSNGNQVAAARDLLLIRAGELKKIWFYFQNSLAIPGDEQSATQKTLHFYWPPNFAAPLTRNSSQSLYTIRSMQDLALEQSTGLRTYFPGADKRIACIPSLE